MDSAFWSLIGVASLGDETRFILPGKYIEAAV